MATKERMLTAAGRRALFAALQARFEGHMDRHPGLDWEMVRARLEADPQKLWAVSRMEETGGEPDVVGGPEKDGSVAFYDCAPQTPAGRRNLCYDQAALDSRKANKPEGSALGLAAEMGIEMLDETQYRLLQQWGEFDTKTSSWVQTPPAVRALGGAMFCDRRYGAVFAYHNGAESYYAVRGFRGMVRI